jgi:CRISPR-associated endoribonuclease Cas6
VIPTRDCVFNSLLSRWNKYSPIAIPDLSFDALFSTFVNIRSEKLTNYESNFVGMVGEVSYRILGDVEPLAIKQVNALADFAVYCGVGRKTPMGMGMTRRIVVKK